MINVKIINYMSLAKNTRLRKCANECYLWKLLGSQRSDNANQR